LEGDLIRIFHPILKILLYNPGNPNQKTRHGKRSSTQVRVSFLREYKLITWLAVVHTFLEYTDIYHEQVTCILVMTFVGTLTCIWLSLVLRISR